MFLENFDFRQPAIVNFVGGGGKTALILRLIEEYSGSGVVLYTTTTRIHPPDISHGLVRFSGRDIALLKRMIEAVAGKGWRNGPKMVITRLETAPGLLRGVPSDFADGLNRSLCPLILNEADGARSMSIKMPRSGEPVLMESANYLVPVIGLDCLGKPLGPETLFRWEMAEARYSLQAGEVLTPELAASLLMHPEGVCKGWSPGMTIVPFINKADSDREDAKALSLARALLECAHFPVEKVLWGSLNASRVSMLAASRQ